VNGTIAVARYTLLELSRRRLLLVFAIIGAAGIALLGIGLKILYSLITSNPSSNGFGNTQLSQDELNKVVETLFVSELFGALSIFALLIAFAVGMTAIYHDLDSGAAVSLFSKPVSRLAYATGKVIAAVMALVVIVGILALESRFVMFLFGGGLENALWIEVLAVVANTVVAMLIVLSLSTWVNNIVAAVIAFVYIEVVQGVVSYVHTLTDQGIINNNIIKYVFDVLYWLIPHQLTSSAIRDVALAAARLQPRGGGAPDPLAGVPPASGAGDIVWWAFVVIAFSVLVYYSVRRRQV
jgi:ABC-type transport system involved in multi-copper enzyme maturation permease subunit